MHLATSANEERARRVRRSLRRARVSSFTKLKGRATIRVIGFFDVYNIFNTNAAQALTTTSGGAWLRPTVITGPRILRIGARLEW